MTQPFRQDVIALDPAGIASQQVIAWLESHLRTVPDFPKPGIQFKDITPLLADHHAFSVTLDLLAQPFIGAGLTQVAAMDARGFIFGGALAQRLGCGFLPVRKAGKLPAEVDAVSYSLEYGEATLQLHKGSLGPQDRVLIVDDLLATGGTAAATVELVQGQGARVDGIAFVIELDFLAGRAKLAEVAPQALIHSVLHVD